ncbi:ABC transporter permease [Nonomuraea polychroma]|uniref:ABC transporter permease n=1 Tax=Nonomuraea polychroma TaxID=46176 RepID=UPI003D943C75
MGRILLVGRLALRDLRRRRIEAALLLLAIMAATTTLTLGLVLRDAADNPYQSTREATNGPDVVAGVGRPANLAELSELAGAPGVIDHSGPYPVTPAKLQTSGRTSDVQAVGRDTASASVDQPQLIQGSWVRDGGVVVEAAFANALDVRVGDPVTLEGRSFEVVGTAVTAAMPPYPGSSCIVAVGCMSGTNPDDLPADLPAGLLHNPGLVWLTQAEVRSLTPDPDSLSYVMNLQLADPNEAQTFVDARIPESRDAPGLTSWKEILEEATQLARDSQILLLIGAWLLGLLAVASLSVLVGGRIADQTRRVGLLKAVGGTPSLVAAVLLAEYVLVAIVAAAAGLALGSLTAPLLTESSAGLVGSAGMPSMTLSTVGLVTAVALGVAVVATVVPAVRAARAGRLATPTPPDRLADRGFGATARAAASRLAGSRPPAATGRAGCGHYRDHGQRDLRPPGTQRLPHHPTTRRRI